MQIRNGGKECVEEGIASRHVHVIKKKMVPFDQLIHSTKVKVNGVKVQGIGLRAQKKASFF